MCTYQFTHYFVGKFLCNTFAIYYYPPPPCSTALLFIDTKAYQQHMRIRIANSRQVASLDLAAAHMQADNSGLFPTA